MIICGLISTEYPKARLDQRRVEAFIIAAAEGNTEALAELYEHTKSAVYGFALSMLRNRHDAEDVLQETFIRAYSAAAGYEPMGKPMAWIFTIARNLAMMKLRERSRTAEVDELSAFEAPEEGLSREERIALNAAVDSLGAEEGQIVMLHAISGLRHREIAELMELPLPTVLSKYHRALKKLKHMLTEGA